MKPTSDAYGQAMLSYLLHKESYEVVERDDGFVGLSSGSRAYFAPYRNWPQVEKKAIKLAKGRVLDVGCGAGRVALFLQRKGFDVTGIDISPKAIEVCRRRGLRRALVLPVEGVHKLKPRSFDTIVMFGNNFGLFGSYEKARRLLKQMHAITSEDAIILAESNDPYKTKIPVHLAYHRLNRRRGRMGGQLRIRIRFSEYVGDWFDYLLASRKEVNGILKGTGWKAKRFVGSGNSIYVAVIQKAP